MREQRLVFGEDADLYDKARPGYPAALIDDVAALAGPGVRALDIGCGTGKATVLLAQRGLRGTGVEADPAMAEVARRNLAPHPGWSIDVSDFETWPGPGAAGLPGAGQFDLVCCAQAWHWLDPAVRLHRAHGLLRPGGWLALWWNRADGPSGGEEEELSGQVQAIYAAVAPQIAAKSGMGTRDQATGDEIPPGLRFGQPVRRSYPWAQDYTADAWVALLRTQSDHRLLPPSQLDELTTRVRRLLNAHGGVYHHRYACRLWAVEKD